MTRGTRRCWRSWITCSTRGGTRRADSTSRSRPTSSSRGWLPKVSPDGKQLFFASVDKLIESSTNRALQLPHTNARQEANVTRSRGSPHDLPIQGASREALQRERGARGASARQRQR